ncbi:MAG: penicillin acylase family protein [Saprospiraceae bacterium]|jgi:penicillin amidase|nr:penicillin acylase family protein [Saprospiraceae bacterium]MBK8513621.1 penicillin acylase family protein [Saprospiraceae bacterium]MBK9680399.1 penicillin acylase family protein [Saprospiraceae bacterium]
MGHYFYCITLLFSLVSSYSIFGQKSVVFDADEINASVTIKTDQWGVSHIYAANERDLFFAQGFQAARDRLFQFEMFRRQATGTLAEVLGEKEIDRDIGARLFQYRGDIQQEMKHYHPRGDIIIKSFVAGINAYIKKVLDGKEKMPLELQWLGIKPGYWTPEVVISRHNGLLSNVQNELQTARWVSRIGAQRVSELMNYHPHLPSLDLDPVLTPDALDEDILKPYLAFRRTIQFSKDNLVGSLSGQQNGIIDYRPREAKYSDMKSLDGSNNWVISGSKTASGSPIMANDPHRSITVPSLRYMTHLHAPGWNVIGGGEPILPGVSIGHNEYGAWGLTIFSTDMEDLYVYPLHPGDKEHYQYNGRWMTFTKINDSIKVKNKPAVSVTHQYTLHGPVTFIDSVRGLVYAVRCAWLEKGSAPYLASLKMNQAKTWKEFREACKHSFVPAENMVWADKKGNIGWQTVGIAPIRRHHSGMVPVTGNKAHEWAGYLPMLKRPHSYNPSEQFIATANANLTSPTYPYLNSIGYNWSDPYRAMRIREVLSQSLKFSVPDMESLQTDYLSIPARQIVPLILQTKRVDPELRYFQNKLAAWDFKMGADKGMAGLYMLTERYLEEYIIEALLPENTDGDPNNDVAIRSISTELLIRILSQPDYLKDKISQEKKEILMITALTKAIKEMKSLFGANDEKWVYGDVEKLKRIAINHMLSPISDVERNKKMNIQPVIRGGYANTVGATGDGNNQNHGASFRIITDCSDWDLAVAINTPGQSGDPESKHYRDLFELWSRDNYFPLFYSDEKIDAVTEKVTVLKPPVK